MDIIKGIKEVADVVRKADNIELYRQILDLQKEALDLVEENHELKNEIRELKKVPDLQKKLTFKNNAYYLDNDDVADGPFCSTCWDARDMLVRLHDNDYGFICDHCLRLNKSN